RCRQVVLIAAVIDGVVDWLSRYSNVEDETRQIGLPAYLVLKRLDDLAYGVGMWTGMVRERNLGPLKPQIRA
ncbi:MAG: mycofactocin system glycosyltransferase, partial [Mycolicibacterium sp.]|nr:mycofactocin system glycosyltransferase [Mycolicibacterium sp.]